jgi:hypothetical protein
MEEGVHKGIPWIKKMYRFFLEDVSEFIGSSLAHTGILSVSNGRGKP